MVRILLYALLTWFLYKLIFGFIIPVYKTTQQMKKKFREMNNNMQGEQQGQQEYNGRTSNQGSAPGSKTKVGDYIDFEEIK